jgi:hypothetical protein
MTLYTNPNMDMEQNNRPERIRELEEHYDNAIEMIKGEHEPDEKREMTPEEKSFMDAARRGQQAILPPSVPGEEKVAQMAGF